MKTYTSSDIDNVLDNPKLIQGITKYEYLITHLNKIDEVFIYNFCTLFKMIPRNFSRAPKSFDFNKFKEKYFKYLQQLYQNPNTDFETVLKKVSSFSYREELSFSSKMYHLVHPDYPIWDSVLTNKNHFNNLVKTDNKLDKYYDYKQKFEEYKDKPQGRLIIRRFNKKFKYNTIGPIKQIDFVLWQDR